MESLKIDSSALGANGLMREPDERQRASGDGGEPIRCERAPGEMRRSWSSGSCSASCARPTRQQNTPSRTGCRRALITAKPQEAQSSSLNSPAHGWRAWTAASCTSAQAAAPPWTPARRRRCLSHEASGNTTQRQCRSQGNRRRKRNAKAVS